jgi:hypothetical protein
MNWGAGHERSGPELQAGMGIGAWLTMLKDERSEKECELGGSWKEMG